MTSTPNSKPRGSIIEGLEDRRLMAASIVLSEGVLNVQGHARRMIFQGVHMLMGGTPGKPWEPGEARESVMVFIGRKIPRRLFEEGLNYCVA